MLMLWYFWRRMRIAFKTGEVIPAAEAARWIFVMHVARDPAIKDAKKEAQLFDVMADELSNEIAHINQNLYSPDPRNRRIAKLYLDNRNARFDSLLLWGEQLATQEARTAWGRCVELLHSMPVASEN